MELLNSTHLLQGKANLLEQVRHAIRLCRYKIRIKEDYLNWIKRFILFHHKRYPKEMGQKEGMGNTVFSCGESWFAGPHERWIEMYIIRQKSVRKPP